MNVIDEYLQTLQEPQRAELARVRNIICSTVPDAQEVISYGMPGFKYKGHYLAGFCAFKNHLSFFPTSGPVEALKDKLSGYKLSRGTIQFTLDQPLPEQLIKEIIHCRLNAILED